MGTWVEIRRWDSCSRRIPPDRADTSRAVLPFATVKFLMIPARGNASTLFAQTVQMTHISHIDSLGMENTFERRQPAALSAAAVSLPNVAFSPPCSGQGRSSRMALPFSCGPRGRSGAGEGPAPRLSRARPRRSSDRSEANWLTKRGRLITNWTRMRDCRDCRKRVPTTLSHLGRFACQGLGILSCW